MLLHDNRLNADMIAQLLDLFEKRGFFGPSTGRSCLSDSRNIRYEVRADVDIAGQQNEERKGTADWSPSRRSGSHTTESNRNAQSSK